MIIYFSLCHGFWFISMLSIHYIITHVSFSYVSHMFLSQQLVQIYFFVYGERFRLVINRLRCLCLSWDCSGIWPTSEDWEECLEAVITVEGASETGLNAWKEEWRLREGRYSMCLLYSLASEMRHLGGCFLLFFPYFPAVFTNKNRNFFAFLYSSWFVFH